MLVYQFRHQNLEPFNRATHAMRVGQGGERSVMLGCGFLHRDLDHLTTEEAQIKMCLSRAPGTCKLASPQID